MIDELASTIANMLIDKVKKKHDSDKNFIKLENEIKAQVKTYLLEKRVSETEWSLLSKKIFLKIHPDRAPSDKVELFTLCISLFNNIKDNFFDKNTELVAQTSDTTAENKSHINHIKILIFLRKQKGFWLNYLVNLLSLRNGIIMSHIKFFCKSDMVKPI